MSVIKRIQVHTHCNDLGGKVWNPAITWTKKYAVFITLETEHGVTGLGECWCFDSAPDVLVAYIKTEIAPHIIGLTPDDCNVLGNKLLSRATLTARHGLLASAWSGIDIALWDLRSREANLPLWKFLQTQRPSAQQHSNPTGVLRLYASGGLYGETKTIDDLVNEMITMTSAGFNIVKMKIGGLSIDGDLERIHAVLCNLDSSCKLIIDGVYSYTEPQALQVFKALPSDRIEAFQSPLKADDLNGMKTLVDSGVPVMATEAEYRYEIHQQLIDSGAVKYLQTAPIACGGISRLLELEKLFSKNKEQRPTLSLEVSSTAIALMAAAHFGAASHRVAHVEYHYLHQVFFDGVKFMPVENRRGYFLLPDAIGLGMELPQADARMVFSL